jgi:stage IV sporulation protein FB
MYPQADNPWIFGFPIATLWGTRIRLNPLYLGIWLWFGQAMGWQLGSLAFGLLTVLILFHELSHVFAARWTGGDAEDVVLWPFGGLALCRRAPTFQSEFLVPAAGPLFHLVVGLVLTPFLWPRDQFWSALHPIYWPELDLEKGLGHVTLVLLYTLNVKALFLNLLPMLPLDGSSMWQAVASQRWEPVNARSATLIASVLTHVVMVLVALNINPAYGVQVLMFLYSLLPITILEGVRLQLSQQMGEFGDSDAFDLTGDDIPRRVRQPGLLERWKLERERKRQEREEQERIETETRLDALLEKINQSGIDSLSDAEKKFLKKASARYRDQGKPS